jgi:hypothetical protein
MKTHSLQKSVLLVLLATLPCCAEKVFGRVYIDDEAYDLQVKECVVVGSQGGPAVYTLNIELEDPSRPICNSIRFSVQDPNNDKDNLLTEGAHAATGAHWDGIRFALLESCNSYYHNQVTSEELEIVWETLSLQTIAPEISYYTGEGYVRIKRPIKVSFPNFLHTYPEQQINFTCDRVLIP